MSKRGKRGRTYCNLLVQKDGREEGETLLVQGREGQEQNGKLLVLFLSMRNVEGEGREELLILVHNMFVQEGGREEGGGERYF